jgi:hypothetical protein
MSYLAGKNSENCTVLTRNGANLRTVLPSLLSRRELRSSLRESHSSLSLPADTPMTSSQGTHDPKWKRCASHDIFLSKYDFFSTFYALFFSFLITLWPIVLVIFPSDNSNLYNRCCGYTVFYYKGDMFRHTAIFRPTYKNILKINKDCTLLCKFSFYW